MAAPTLNQVVKSLNDIATNHQQINHFFFGETWDFATNGEVNCPIMMAVLKPLPYNKNTLTYTFDIFIGDIVHKDLSNKTEVLSDTLQIALDVVYELQDPTYNWVLDNVNSITFNDFEDSFDIELYGYQFEVRLKVAQPFDRCAIPST